MDESTQNLEFETQYEWSIGLSLLRNENFQQEEDDDIDNNKLHVSPLLTTTNSSIHIHTSLLDDEHELFSDELCSNDIYANNNLSFINLSTEYSHTNNIYNSAADMLRYDNKKTINPDSSDTSSDGSEITNIYHQNSSDSVSNISPASSIKVSEKKTNRQSSSLKSPTNQNIGKRKKASDSARGILMNWINKNRDYPYPSRAEKADLASRTGLSIAQIVHWMSNIRKRRLIPLLSGKRVATSKIDHKFLEEMHYNL